MSFIPDPEAFLGTYPVIDKWLTATEQSGNSPSIPQVTRSRVYSTEILPVSKPPSQAPSNQQPLRENPAVSKREGSETEHDW